MPRVQVDMSTVDQSQAAALVAHHLALAAAFFQALPEGDEAKTMRLTIEKQFQSFSLEKTAAAFFVASIIESYDKLKDND